MDILARFLHLQVQERRRVTPKGVKVEKRETMIFPRFHQLDAVRSLVRHSRANGSGHNYLVQHSAGSGKSNSIAWLAHRLSSLHDGETGGNAVMTHPHSNKGANHAFCRRAIGHGTMKFEAQKSYPQTFRLQRFKKVA